MNMTSKPVGPELSDLTGLFAISDHDFSATVIPSEQVPEPYHGLLVHTHHMTVTVERFHNSPVDVRVMDVRREDDLYSRQILLATQKDARVVQFGIVRVHLDRCSTGVRAEIEAGQTPLGRILINHDVLRTIHPTAYLKVEPGAGMCEWFGLAEPTRTYGRLGVIVTDHQPAIEVLEILAPVGR